MRVLSSSQIREADQYTIRREPISSIDLMERASIACVNKLLELFPNQSHYSIYCGTGNNGGDGLAIARLLLAKNISVDVSLVRFSEKLSEDNAINLKRLEDSGVTVAEYSVGQTFAPVPENTVLVDALVGTGLTRPLSGLLLDTVTFLNTQNCMRVAIDIPSGMYSDMDNSTSLNAIFKATTTLTFEVPKLNFFLPSLQPFVGHWHLLDIGLNKSFIEELESPYTFVDLNTIAPIIKQRTPFAHKGSFGHGLIVSGSYGKMGAAVLASHACISSGAGLVSAFVPSCGYEIIQTRVPEVMVHSAESEMELSGTIDYSPYTAIGVGPGIGQDTPTMETVQHLLTTASCTLVLDADALNLLGKDKSLLSSLPKNTILTPHLKEFERMFGATKSCFDRLQRQRDVSIEYGVYIILKGKFSSISCPDGSIYFNSTGNPGMATAGSGDVLTGILTGLLCQGYTPHEGAILGTYLHGLAGDLYADDFAEESLIASKIIDYLGSAFHFLQENA